MDLDRQGDGSVEDDQSNLAIGFESPGYDPEEDDEEDDDTINGLTFPEMRTVIQQASDGTISNQERADAAMLMLGMAGGDVSFTPRHFTPPPSDSWH